jgi:hypothetical protein
MLQAELQLNIHQLNIARESHKTKKKKSDTKENKGITAVLGQKSEDKVSMNYVF